MADITIYQKKTCITCKKALAYLDEQGVAYDSKDIETDPPSMEQLDAAIDETRMKDYLNSRSKIYKEKSLGKSLPNKQQLLAWMQADPNLIKRPVIFKNGRTNPIFGFDPEQVAAYLKN